MHKIKMHWTCCNKCHRSHANLLTARLHWIGLRIVKCLNPLIWCWNIFKYFAHLETYRDSKPYEPYDFDAHDTRYF